MAVCTFCQTEMLDGVSCLANPVVVKAGVFAPLPYGGAERCHDCGVPPGGFHHRGCDSELCPHCAGQLIGWRGAPARSAGLWSEDHFCHRAPVVTTIDIYEGRVVPLYVFRGDEGWQVLDGGEVDVDSLKVAWVTDITDIDPSLVDVLDLPVDWLAERFTPTGPWSRESAPR